MAKPSEADAARAAEAAADAREGEAEAVEEQQAEEETASARRERQAERAEGLKSVPEGAAAPTEKKNSKGDATYQRDWLIANAQNVVGCDSHVLVGALYGDAREYLTVEQAAKAVEAWQGTMVTLDPNESEEV